jgi:Holliday junction resolvase RusA-like endonuclease
MYNVIEFEFFEKPVGKSRPKFNSKTRKTYTPEKTKFYEKKLGLLVYDYINRKGITKFSKGIPLEISVFSFYAIPKSTNKENREKMLSGLIRPCVKPDSDNVLKLILDALNGIAYHDDNQICNIIFSKKYDEIPRTVIKIKEIDETDK